ncbi:MAG: PEP-CTERM sorting domain-containing protein [Rubrivivax sp.]|nr:MAG: PEP-CTERM sorting domain-containing protein [Rubrivivax sp.]
MQSIFTRGLVAALSLSAGSWASAFDPVAIQSSSGISRLSYTVQDLNEQDGLGPLFIPSTNPQANLTTLTAGSYTYPNSPASVKFTSLPFDGTGQTLTGPDFTAASKSGNDLAAKTNLMLPTLANVVQSQTYTPIPATASVTSTTLWTLGAYSEVTIQGVIASAIGFDIAQLLNAGTQPESAFVAETNYASFFYTKDAAGNQTYLSGRTGGSLYGRWSIQDGVLTGEHGGTLSKVPSASVSKTFTLTATNNSAFTQDVYLVFTTESWVSWSRTPDNLNIPEPSTYALMGLGMGLMAWRVRTARRT